MILTDSDVIGYVTQGLRRDYGRDIDATQTMRDWLDTHDGRVADLAAAFAPHHDTEAAA